MADFLQAKIDIVHKIESGNPTSSESPTSPKKKLSEKSVGDLDEDNIDAKGLRKIGGRTSILRRLSNMTVSAVDGQVNRQFDNALFRESLYGDRRSVRRIQNNKATYNAISTVVKSTTGAYITSSALNNYAILGLHIANMAGGMVNNLIDLQSSRAEFETKRDMEIYTANQRRERIYVGTYNRR